VFFLVPYFAPKVMPNLQFNQSLTGINDVIVTTTERKAAPSDVKKRLAAIELWDAANTRISKLPESTEAERAMKQYESTKLGARPSPLNVGDMYSEVERTGGRGIYWTGAITPVDERGEPLED